MQMCMHGHGHMRSINLFDGRWMQLRTQWQELLARASLRQAEAVQPRRGSRRRRQLAAAEALPDSDMCMHLI